MPAPPRCALPLPSPPPVGEGAGSRYASFTLSVTVAENYSAGVSSMAATSRLPKPLSFTSLINWGSRGVELPASQL